MNNAYDTQLRALMCPNCGAPVSTSLHGGQYQCGYCRSVGSIGARIDGRPQRPPPTPAEEHARLAKLRFQFDQGPLASPYSSFTVPTDVVHVVQLRPPQSWGPWFEAWKYAVALVAQEPNAHNQKRVAWLVNLTGTAVLDLGANDPGRARAIRETALELLPDPGHKHLIRCALSRGATLQRDVASAEQWLAACDPWPGNLTLDTDYRMSTAALYVARGHAAGVLEVLGNQPGVIPIDYGRDLLTGLMRVHALEELGYAQAADAQLRWWFEEEKKKDAPILLSIIKANTPINLCRRTCARLGIQVPN